ncbi:flavodoxin family protein [Planctomycetota bacterium]
MKILTLQGSPRADGNTATVLKEFENLVQQNHTVERVNIADLQIHGCLGCLGCQSDKNKPGCRQVNDDANAVLEKICAADVVIYATPLYCWSFSAQLKALLDRHLCLVKGIFTNDQTSLIQGKQLALLVTCGGSEEASADIIQELFNRIAHFCQCQILGKYILPFCTGPDALPGRTTSLVQAMVRDIEGL